jgi:hypothetical protein
MAQTSLCTLLTSLDAHRKRYSKHRAKRSVSGLGDWPRGKCAFSRRRIRWHIAFTVALERRTALLGSRQRDAMSHGGERVGSALSSLVHVEVEANADFTVESGACRMKMARRTRKGAV